MDFETASKWAHTSKLTKKWWMMYRICHYMTVGSFAIFWACRYAYGLDSTPTLLWAFNVAIMLCLQAIYYADLTSDTAYERAHSAAMLYDIELMNVIKKMDKPTYARASKN